MVKIFSQQDIEKMTDWELETIERLLDLQIKLVVKRNNRIKNILLNCKNDILSHDEVMDIVKGME